ALDVTNHHPDLIVTNVQTAASAFSGEKIDVTFTVKNVGDAPVWSGTASWTDYVYISPDPTFDPSDPTSYFSLRDRMSYGGSAVHRNDQPLAPGASYTVTVSVTLPEGIEGRRYVHVFTDRNPGAERYGLDDVGPGQFPDWPEQFRYRVWEDGAKWNNTGRSAPVQVVYREADLQVTAMTVPATPTPASGGLVDLSWTVSNTGTRTTRVATWVDRVFISQDPSLDTYDELIGTVRHDGALDPGATYDVTTSVRLPDNISGSFYLIVFADSAAGRAPFGAPLPYPLQTGPARLGLGGAGMVAEYRGEGNNLARSAITVSRVDAPDLQVTRVEAPQHVTVGQGFSLTYDVTNRGPGVVPDRQNRWIDRVYLSRDKFLDVRSDHYITQVEHTTGTLDVDGYYTVQLTGGVPRGLTGAYYVLVQTDVSDPSNPWGQVYESDRESNNVSASVVPMLLELPPPADLLVERIVTPGAAQVGRDLALEWTVVNRSTESVTGYWDDSAYLSRDAVWDLGDPILGRVSRGAAPNPTTGQGPVITTLGPGARFTSRLTTLLPATLPDNYRVIVRADV
ncbi:MAG TPA: CARDB domain-containing protein, partial [Pirellulaceae bacterium]|nr:CARDB domain-containing protein [Pirellulaceae bacterium]